jgi:hypothetical protein
VATAATADHYGFSIAIGDYDLDGWLDLHTTEWRPDARNPTARLLRNRGRAAPGSFEDVTGAAGVALRDVVPGQQGTFALTSRFTDLDGDGWPDLLVTGDLGTSRLFWNDGDGTFSDGTVAAGVGTEENGVGLAVGDYDGDGALDAFVTSIYDPSDASATGNRLYRNLGNRSFADETDTAGVRDGYWGTGAAFYELDNDGDLDLVMTNGAHVPHLDPTEAAAYARFVDDPLRVWRNDGASMSEVSAALEMDDTGPGRGLLTFDYDNDGDLDLFVVNNAGTPRLYRNDFGGSNRWLRVETVGTDSNRDGIGAIVAVWLDVAAAPQIREISAGSHFLGQSEFTAHFGLGAHSGPVPRVQVYWPATGRVNDFADVAPNTTLVAVEPGGVSGSGVTPASAPGVAASSGSSGGACGLLGVEPLLLLPSLSRRWRRRRA